ncbi:MAG TPA: pyrimidine reductase family protein [Pseudonocardia sp.]|nr:pyrimidine reductase family protein [Pseudonocardia sp.]
MIELLPVPGGPLDVDELAARYAYPDPLTRPYVRVNFVTSADGAVAMDGRSRGLSSKPDRRVFRLLRDLCDVVLVGAGTARAERYRGVRRRAGTRDDRAAPARIAVVTSSAELDPASGLFTDTEVAPLVLTTPDAPSERLDRLATAGAEVVTCGTEPTQLLGALEERGLRRVLCEGGPVLFGRLIEADAVDELCLTHTPLLVAGDAGRIAGGTRPVTRQLRLASVLTEEDALLLRYLRSP